MILQSFYGLYWIVNSVCINKVHLTNVLLLSGGSVRHRSTTASDRAPARTHRQHCKSVLLLLVSGTHLLTMGFLPALKPYGDSKPRVVSFVLSSWLISVI